MKLIAAFFKLVRWPNLVFILLTQVLFLYAVVIPLSGMDTRTMLGDWGLWLIIVSSVLIAASGYIINDYFDINIDLINKPRKLIVDKIINRRWAMFFHIAFSGMGVLMGFYYDWIHHCFWLGASNLVCVVLLFGYSIRLKKTLLTGNILISLFTAWVIGVIFIHCYFMINLAGLPPNGNTFIRISFLYMTFSFIISLIREVIKDMEDMDGDLKYGCRTMPISWGIPASKVFVAVCICVLTGILIIIQFYVARFAWWFSILYWTAAIIAPLLYVLSRLYRSHLANQFHQLSSLVKFIMFTGILSMMFFRIYL